MVEVFKTNVTDTLEGHKIINAIHANFVGCKANFDLDDCDNILRVKSVSEPVAVSLIIHLVNKHGFVAEVLPDLVPVLQG